MDGSKMHILYGPSLSQFLLTLLPQSSIAPYNLFHAPYHVNQQKVPLAHEFGHCALPRRARRTQPRMEVVTQIALWHLRRIESALSQSAVSSTLQEL